jgi:hypothetical protein
MGERRKLNAGCRDLTRFKSEPIEKRSWKCPASDIDPALRRFFTKFIIEPDGITAKAAAGGLSRIHRPDDRFRRSARISETFSSSNVLKTSPGSSPAFLATPIP